MYNFFKDQSYKCRMTPVRVGVCLLSVTASAAGIGFLLSQAVQGHNLSDNYAANITSMFLCFSGAVGACTSVLCESRNDERDQLEYRLTHGQALPGEKTNWRRLTEVIPQADEENGLMHIS